MAPDELPNQHIEAKGLKNPVLRKSTLLTWWDQIHKDPSPGQLPVIIFKGNLNRPVALLPKRVVEELEGFYDVLACCVEESLHPTKELDKASAMRNLMNALQDEPPSEAKLAVAFLLAPDKVLIAVELDTWVAWAKRYESTKLVLKGAA